MREEQAKEENIYAEKLDRAANLVLKTAENAADIEIMRIVVRENFTSDMAAILVKDIENACKFCENGRKSETKKPCPPDDGMVHIC